MASFLGSSAVNRIGLHAELASFQASALCRQGLLVSQRTRIRHHGVPRRPFSQQTPKRPRFSTRLRDALSKSKIQWYQIPVGVGIGFVGLMHLYKVTKREREKKELEQQQDAEGGNGGKRPKKRPRIRPDGPWLAFLRSPEEARLIPQQASQSHVDLAPEGLVSAVGQIQRARYPVLPACAGFSALFLHFRSHVGWPLANVMNRTPNTLQYQRGRGDGPSQVPKPGCLLLPDAEAGRSATRPRSKRIAVTCRWPGASVRSDRRRRYRAGQGHDVQPRCPVGQAP